MAVPFKDKTGTSTHQPAGFSLAFRAFRERRLCDALPPLELQAA
jgi:hypothetical protein